MSTTVTYKGSTLTTVENATKKLTTTGTWLEDDITIQDVSSGGGGSVLVVDTPDSHGGTIREITATNTVTLQGQKQVTLTTSPQTITPDTGYDGFTSVVVPKPLENVLEAVIAGTITSYINDTITSLPDSFMRPTYFNKITTFQAHAVTYMSNFALVGVGAPALAFPNLVQNGTGQVFNGATKVTTLDIGASFSSWRQQFTQNMYNLDTIILRKPTVVALGSVTAFNVSDFKNGGTGGTIYIPKSLYDHLGDGTADDYQSATNWATIYGYGTITWAQIEGSQYENYYADGTPIPTT